MKRRWLLFVAAVGLCAFASFSGIREPPTSAGVDVSSAPPTVPSSILAPPVPSHPSSPKSISAPTSSFPSNVDLSLWGSDPAGAKRGRLSLHDTSPSATAHFEKEACRSLLSMTSSEVPRIAHHRCLTVTSGIPVVVDQANGVFLVNATPVRRRVSFQPLPPASAVKQYTRTIKYVGREPSIPMTCGVDFNKQLLLPSLAGGAESMAFAPASIAYVGVVERPHHAFQFLFSLMGHIVALREITTALAALPKSSSTGSEAQAMPSPISAEGSIPCAQLRAGQAPWRNRAATLGVHLSVLTYGQFHTFDDVTAFHKLAKDSG